jgi:hypothetical protein
LSEARQNISIASGGEATESAWPPDRIDPPVRGAPETANIKRHLNAFVGAGDKLRARALRMGDFPAVRHPPDCLRFARHVGRCCLVNTGVMFPDTTC